MNPLNEQIRLLRTSLEYYKQRTENSKKNGDTKLEKHYKKQTKLITEKLEETLKNGDII